MFVESKNKVKTIRQGEPDFSLVDGMVVYPRAMIHVLPECPSNVRHHINWAIANGYLKAVAHVYDYEHTMDKLKE
jgi:hypothetical protein